MGVKSACAAILHAVLVFALPGETGRPRIAEDFACAAGGQEGGNLRFPPSCQSSSFPQARHGRGLSQSRQTASTHLLLRQARFSCHPRGARIFLLAASKKWAAGLRRNALLRASARPDLRQQMPQIFGQTLLYLFSLTRKRGDSQEGRNLWCLPSCAPAPRRRTLPVARRRRNLLFALSGEKSTASA